MRIWIISDLIDCIKWEINFWKNPTLHKLKMLSNETVEGDPLFSMQFWRIITWPIHVIWWIIVCIFFRPIRWIVNKSKGVKTKKDGSVDHRYIDEDEAEDEDAETAETAESAETAETAETAVDTESVNEVVTEKNDNKLFKIVKEGVKEQEVALEALNLLWCRTHGGIMSIHELGRSHLKQTKKLVVDKRYDGLWDSGEKFYHYALLCSEGLNEYLEELDNQTVEESGQRFDQSLFFNDNSKFYNWVNSKYFASILYKFDSLKVVDTADPDDFTDDEYFRQWCSEKNEDNIIQNNVKSNKDKPPCTKWAIDIIYNHLSYERNIDLKVNFKEGFFGGNSIRNWNDKFIKKDFSKDEEFGCMVFDFQNSREAWDKELKLRNQKVQKNLDKFMKKYGLALAE